MGGGQTVTRRGRGRWRRRLAWAAGGAFALLLGALATLDFWVPPAAEAWLGGVSFSRRETRAGETISWEKLAWAEEGVTLQAERAGVSAPWRMLRSGRARAEASGWVLTIAPGGTGKKTPGGSSRAWETLIPALRRAGQRMSRRVDSMDLRDGMVRVGGEEIQVERLLVNGADLSGTARLRGQTLEFEAKLAGGTARLRWVEGGVEGELAIGPEAANGEIRWEGNRAALAAEFEPGKWMPEALALDGTDWRVPAERLRLGARYGELRGDFSVRHEGADKRLSVTADATALPREEAEGFPEVKIALGAEARPEAVRLERLEIAAPELRASLSAPLEWRRADKAWVSAGEPVFTWAAELGALSGGRVTGRAGGSARWSGGAQWRIAWDARGEGLGWETVRGVTAVLRGETRAAATEVEEAELRGADGATVNGSGRYVYAGRQIEAGRFRAELPGAALTPWLPAGLKLGSVKAEGKIDGPLADPQVKGTVVLGNAEYKGWAADRAEAAVSGSRAALAVKVKAERAGAWVAADLATAPGQVETKALNLRRSDGRELALTGPATLRLEPGRRALAAELAGKDERLRVNWEEGVSAAVFIQNLNTLWLSDWHPGAAWPLVTVRRFQTEGRPDGDGWIGGAGDFDLAWTRADGPAGWARGEGSLGAQGLRLGRLEIGQAGETLASGEGGVPWRFKAGAREASPVEGGNWSLRLESRPEATLWDSLARLAKVELERPALKAALTGPATEPSGRVELSAARIGLNGEGLPDGGLELRALDAVATVSRGNLALERLAGEVDGQRIEGEGRLALAAGDWEKLRAQPFVWLRDHAEAQVRLPGAQVAALARYLPTVLAPQGVVEADLRLSPGANLDGVLRLRGASTRPIGSFGVLQEIEAELALTGREVRVTRLRGLAGGQEVTITGGARRVPGKMPLLDLNVRAERFPLVRRPGLLLRGDLDLSAKTEAAPDGSAGRTRVTGTVRLRDSLFLADIRPLIAAEGGSAAAVSARPPYFSVETKPLSEWELDLRVEGDRFLRMRTPVFEGTGSAGFDLEGTLHEPRARGEFRVDRGTILFPFATFTVQEGAVRLTRADPYTPLLDFRATGRRLGYDLRLEVNGTASSPQLQFFSSPPLEAETLVLMVTAGTAPREGQGTASTSQRLAAVGAYVGRDLLRTLGVGGADEDRLTVSAGEKVSRQGRETYGFEFRLTDKWALAGEYDEFDAYNVGLKRSLRQAEPAADKKKEEASDAR